MNGKELQKWRKARKLSTKQIADTLGISHRTIEGWETRGVIPENKQIKVERLITQETLNLRIRRDLYLRLVERAREKGFDSPDAFANELFGTLLVLACVCCVGI